MSRLTTPFAQPTIELAYTAYCAMPHMKREGARKPRKTTWINQNRERWEEYQQTIREAKGETDIDLLQALAETLADAGVDASLLTRHIKTTTTTTKTRERREAPEDAARNAKLWRLNVEGLLPEAIARADDDYITDELAGQILTEAFGPPEKR